MISRNHNQPGGKAGNLFHHAAPSFKPARLIILFFSLTTFANGLENNPFNNTSYADYDLPLAIYYNPSLIVKQQDNLFGINYYAPAAAAADSFALSAAYIKTFDDRAISLGYHRETGPYPDFLSAAFSHAFKSFVWGIAAHTGLSSVRPVLCLDIAASWYYQATNLAGFILRNAVVTDTLVFKPQAAVVFAGALPVIERLFYQFDATSQLQDYATSPDNFILEMQIHKSWFKNPVITLGAGVGMEYQKDNGYTMREQGSFALEFTAGRARTGLQAGGASERAGRKAGAAFSLAPFAMLDTAAPVVSLRTGVDTTAAERRMILAITCNDHGYGIDHWQLVLSAVTDIQSIDQATRLFTGGTLPPSTIIWDGRDQQGAMVKGGTYYARLIVFDTHGNRAQTPWSSIDVP